MEHAQAKKIQHDRNLVFAHCRADSNVRHPACSSSEILGDCVDVGFWFAVAHATAVPTPGQDRTVSCADLPR